MEEVREKLKPEANLLNSPVDSSQSRKGTCKEGGKRWNLAVDVGPLRLGHRDGGDSWLV